MKWHKEELKKFREKVKDNYPEFTTANGTVVISQIFRMVISGEWTYEKALKGLGRKITPDAYSFDRKIAIESGDYSQDKCLQDLINRELPKYCNHAIQGEVLICSMWGPNGGIAIYQDFAGKDPKEILPVLELNADDYYKFMLEILEGHKDNQLTKVLKDVTYHDTLRMLKNKAFELASKLEGYEENIKRIFELIQVAYRYGQGWSGYMENVQYTENLFGCAVVKCKENFVPQHEFTKDLIMYLKDHKKRYKLGQFFTVNEHARKIAEKVWEVHLRTGLKMKESTVGTGAITIELIRIIKQAKGSEWRDYCKRFLLPPSDIDPVFANVAEQLINAEGLDYKVEVKDVFDIKKFDWIEYGNPPYNAGSDYLYLARMVAHMIDNGLKHFVFMTNATLVDENTAQRKRILGEEFYERVTEFLEKDIKNYGCSVAFVEYNVNIVNAKKEVFDSGKFTKLKAVVESIKTLSSVFTTRGNKFEDKTPLYSTDYNIEYSIPFLRQTDVSTRTIKYRVPSPTAPVGTKEKEMYEKYVKEKEPYKSEVLTGLVVSVVTTSKKEISLKYVENFECISNNLRFILGDKSTTGVLGLILTSGVFSSKLYKHFTEWQKSQRQITKTQLEQFPIPKQIPQRLYDIGQQLIIEGKEDEELRKEADKIIEELYKELEV